jgi:hypothetical protein
MGGTLPQLSFQKEGVHGTQIGMRTSVPSRGSLYSTTASRRSNNTSYSELSRQMTNRFAARAMTLEEALDSDLALTDPRHEE